MTRLALVPVREKTDKDVYDWDNEGKAVYRDFSADEIFAQRVESIWTTWDGRQSSLGPQRAKQKDEGVDQVKKLSEAKEEMVLSLRKAQNELLLANDLLSLLRPQSKQKANGKVEADGNLPLEPGTFIVATIDEPTLPFIDHPKIALRQMQEKLIMKENSWSRAHQALLTLQTSTSLTLESGRRFWKCAWELRDNGWGLSCTQDMIQGIDSPRKIRRLVVRFGLDAMSEAMKKQCVAILERDEKTGRPELKRTNRSLRLRCRLLRTDGNGDMVSLHPMTPYRKDREPFDSEDVARLDHELEDARTEMIDSDMFSRLRHEAKILGLLQSNGDPGDHLDIKIGVGCILRIANESVSEDGKDDEYTMSSSPLVSFDLGQIIYHTFRILYVRGLQTSRLTSKVDIHGGVTSTISSKEQTLVNPVVSFLADWVATLAVKKTVDRVSAWVQTIGYTLESREKGGRETDMGLPSGWKEILIDPSLGLTRSVAVSSESEIKLTLSSDGQTEPLDSRSISIKSNAVIHLSRGAALINCASESELENLLQRECLDVIFKYAGQTLRHEFEEDWQFKTHYHSLLISSRSIRLGIRVDWVENATFNCKRWEDGVFGTAEQVTGSLLSIVRQRLQEMMRV